MERIKFSKELAAAGTELTKYLNLKLIKCHTAINRGTVIHPSIFSVIGPYPFQPYIKLNQTFFPENLDILSKILKIMTRLTLTTEVKKPSFPCHTHN